MVTAEYESTAGSLDYSLGASEYVYAGLGAYSALSGSLLKLGGYESPRLAGIEYGLPTAISDLPTAVVGIATMIQMTSQLESGDVSGAVETGGSGLGGTFGGSFGAEVGGAIGAPFGGVGAVVGGLAGGFFGGLGGSYVGGAGASFLYNNASAVGSALGTWGRNFTPYSFALRPRVRPGF